MFWSSSSAEVPCHNYAADIYENSHDTKKDIVEGVSLLCIAEGIQRVEGRKNNHQNDSDAIIEFYSILARFKGVPDHQVQIQENHAIQAPVDNYEQIEQLII